MCYRFPEIHLWCNTCQPFGSQANLFHIPASRHWWDSKTGWMHYQLSYAVSAHGWLSCYMHSIVEILCCIKGKIGLVCWQLLNNLHVTDFVKFDLAWAFSIFFQIQYFCEFFKQYKVVKGIWKKLIIWRCVSVGLNMKYCLSHC